MTCVWVTDCDSAVNVLHRVGPVKTADKRLGIEFASMRQSIWRTRGEQIGDPMLRDTLPMLEDRTDHVRWCDTDVMIVDALTKQISPDKLVQALEDNLMDLRRPQESSLKKKIEPEQRSKARGI